MDQLFAIFKIPIIKLKKFITHWHKIIGYIGPKAVKYLQNVIEGIKIWDLKLAPKIINCEKYSILKIK